MRLCILAATACLFLAHSGLLAQERQYRYRRPIEPDRRSEFSVNLRYTSPVDISFSNLGAITAPSNFAGDRGPGFYANDGHVAADGSYLLDDDGNLIPDGEGGFLQVDGLGLRGPGLKGETVNFAYESSALQVSEDGGTLALTQVTAPDLSLTSGQDSGGTFGWELQYTYYPFKSKKFALTAGFAFGIADSAFGLAQQLSGSDAFARRINVELGTGSGFSDDAYSGPLEKPINPTNEDPILTVLFNQALLNNPEFANLTSADFLGQYDFGSANYTFRLGPTYDFTLFEGLDARISAGFVAIFVSSDLRASARITNIFIDEQAYEGADSFVSATSSRQQWLYGGYADANARYEVNDRVTLFSGMQFQSTTDYEADHEGGTVEIDMSAVFHVKSGFSFSF